MFNTRASDDMAVVEGITKMAASRVQLPGQVSSGNASGAVPIASNAVPFGVPFQGVAADGTVHLTMLTDIDKTNGPTMTE